MPFFRRTLDPTSATVRPAVPTDVAALNRLLNHAGRRYIGLSAEHIGSLLASAPALVMESNGELWGAVLAGWRVERVCWLRVLLLTDGLLVGPSLDVLLPSFHHMLRAHGLSHVFYAGDSAADPWLMPGLFQRGYVRDTEVVVYEKLSLDVPSVGNREVRVRQATPVDLGAVLTIDQACFTPEWVKDDGVLGPALMSDALFVIAEYGGKSVGYAYATSHFSGRLVHLVRIAVLPGYRKLAIGARLLSHVVEHAHRYGATAITLNTQSHNYSAQRLYEWYGFHRTGERQVILRHDL